MKGRFEDGVFVDTEAVILLVLMPILLWLVELPAITLSGTICVLLTP
jgi:hypothetical protein